MARFFRYILKQGFNLVNMIEEHKPNEYSPDSSKNDLFNHKENESKDLDIKTNELLQDKPCTEKSTVSEEVVDKKVYNELKEKYDDLWEKYLRLLAEFDNYKKRQEREAQSLWDIHFIIFIKEFLPFFDEFNRAISQLSSQESNPQIQAVLYTQEILKNLLKKLEVSEIDVNYDIPDIEKCEVVAAVPVSEKEKDKKIVQILEKGYKYKDKIIRYAKVIIGKYEEESNKNQS